MIALVTELRPLKKVVVHPCVGIILGLGNITFNKILDLWAVPLNPSESAFNKDRS